MLLTKLLGAQAEVNPNFYIYLCFGQSNMEGNAQWETVDNQKVDERFQMLATTNFDNPKRSLGEWYTAYCPIVSPMGKLGPTDYFGRTMVAALPSDVKVGVVAVAMGGSPIEMFDKDKYKQKLAQNPNEWWATLSNNYYGGNPYGRLIDMAKKAQEVGVIKGILLHQGCSNNGDPNWPNMVKKIYNDMLTDLGLNAADVPIFVGETERQDMGGGCWHHNAVVAKIPQVIPTGHVVSSEGLPGNGVDAWHFSAPGYRTFGKRYAFEALRTMGIEPKANTGYDMPENLKNFFTPKKFTDHITKNAGTTVTLKLECTFADNHTEDLTSEAVFTSKDFTITDGVVKLGEDGSKGTVTATYTDFLGEKHEVVITLEASGSNGLGKAYTNLNDLDGKHFAIVNEAEEKAFFGSDNQNLGYDVYEKAFVDTNTGYLFKLEKASSANGYLLRLITPSGSEYSIWGSPGYLNAQSLSTGWCCFILGLNGQNGQDLKNGAVWDIQYVDGRGFTLKNVATGKYLHNAGNANFDEPAYFTFCEIGSTPDTDKPSSSATGLSANTDKFLGNITTGWGSDMDTNGFKFSDYWNQVTPENATKWESVERTRGHYDWSGADKAANYAKQKGFPFKFHTLIWGSQYPKWMDNLSVDDQYKAIEKWMDEVKKHYPDLEMIDVVNEAIAGHAPAPYKAALGGDGKTGYDWIIKAFEMAHERWPNAILIYNDYNTFQWNTDQFIDLVRVLRDAGAPIDAYGCQSHDLGGVDKTKFAAAMKKIQDALKMPMYITEYDIGDTNDANQKWNFQQHFPVMWEADYCAGVTLWGWIYGQTWINNDQTGEKGISGIIKNGQERSALKWLREYMQTEKAIKAKSPFPGMVKEASLYVKPSTIVTTKGELLNIDVQASMRTKTIDHVDLYINNTLVKTMTAAPFEAEYTPEKEGKYEIKAIATTTDGTEYQRLSGFTVYAPREAYNGVKQIPGTIEAEDFDAGAEGLSYHDSDNQKEGDATSYRSNGGGVDIVKGNGGYAIGYTATGEWLEYSVNVTVAGEYTCEAFASCGSEGGSAFSISLVKDGQVTPLCKINVPMTANSDWGVYKAVKEKFNVPLEAGEQILRITIDKPYVNIDKLVLTCTKTGIDEIRVEDGAPQVYNLSGQKVDANYKGIVIKNGKKIINR